MLNVHRLAVLHAVVTTGSVTGAAAELNYTPSAVSQHIAALERETGASLLERIGAASGRPRRGRSCPGMRPRSWSASPTPSWRSRRSTTAGRDACG